MIFEGRTTLAVAMGDHVESPDQKFSAVLKEDEEEENEDFVVSSDYTPARKKSPIHN